MADPKTEAAVAAELGERFAETLAKDGIAQAAVTHAKLTMQPAASVLGRGASTPAPLNKATLSALMWPRMTSVGFVDSISNSWSPPVPPDSCIPCFLTKMPKLVRLEWRSPIRCMRESAAPIKQLDEAIAGMAAELREDVAIARPEPVVRAVWYGSDRHQLDVFIPTTFPTVADD